METRVAITVMDPPYAVEAIETDIDALERRMRRAGPAVSIEPTHHFAPGIYAREIRIPAGTLLTGKIHKTRHLNIVSAGWIAVYTATEGWKALRAPCSFVAEPGTRRIGYALEDTVWTTVHGTTETDLDALEAELIAPHNSEQEALCPG